MNDPHKGLTGNTGWRQFLTNRRQILDEYDREKEKSAGHTVQVHHGNVGEALVRDWLKSFLPRKYDVTAGYIVSHRDTERTLPHFDIIIFDALNSPVLWHEDVPGGTRSAAIPVEHVFAVVEVKAAWTAASAPAALAKLSSLSRFAGSESLDAGDRYPHALRPNFVSLVFFIEHRSRDGEISALLPSLLPDSPIPGYCGAVILRSDVVDPIATGGFELASSAEPVPAQFPPPDAPQARVWGMTASKNWDGFNILGLLNFYPGQFGRAAFDLLARMEGTYRPGMVSSMHAMIWMAPTS